MTGHIGQPPRRGLLFTDLDGTLLDHDTYRPSPDALRTVERLADHGVLTVPVSSKTAPEIRQLARTARLPEVAVAEGGAVLVLGDLVRPLGTPRSRLLEALDRLRGAGWQVSGMSEMSVEEVSRRTGLDRSASMLAMDRQASEPFVFNALSTPLSVDEVERRLAALDVEVTRGGRFWHLVGRGVDKGAGVEAVCHHYRWTDRTHTAAVGDAWNDLPMLRAVGVGVLLGGRLAPEEVPDGILRVESLGPAGFVRAIDMISRILAWTSTDRAGE